VTPATVFSEREFHRPKMFGQTFSPGDLATLALLVVLESLLSIDNALVLGVLAQRLASRLRAKALSYGLIGGIILRLAATAAAAILIRWSILELVGGAYLLWIAIRYFAGKPHNPSAPASLAQRGHAKLWSTVIGIELMDLAFAVDSILAAVALVGPAPRNSTATIHPKFWLIAVGGVIGVILMRFAAAGLAVILERFPRLHRSAYLLILLIGLKLVVDWAGNDPLHPHRIDFQNPARIETWIFWGCAFLCLVLGLLNRKPPAPIDDFRSTGEGPAEDRGNH
jgi:YkoY family integral membrane protein